MNLCTPRGSNTWWLDHWHLSTSTMKMMMVDFSGKKGPVGPLIISSETSKQVDHFRFIASIIFNDLSCYKNVMSIIQKVQQHFFLRQLQKKKLGVRRHCDPVLLGGDGECTDIGNHRLTPPERIRKSDECGTRDCNLQDWCPTHLFVRAGMRVGTSHTQPLAYFTVRPLRSDTDMLRPGHSTRDNFYSKTVVSLNSAVECQDWLLSVGSEHSGHVCVCVFVFACVFGIVYTLNQCWKWSRLYGVCTCGALPLSMTTTLLLQVPVSIPCALTVRV